MVAVPVMGQAQEHEPHVEGSGEHASLAVGSIRPLYEQFRSWLVATAEDTPEEVYAFRPSPEVRTLGQIVGHVASANYLFCSTAMGEETPVSQNYEELAEKAALVEALKAAFAYCDGSYEMSDTKAMEHASLFGQENTRLWVLNFNATHNSEHYGNLVTYMRINGLTPPSSR
jgi:uncharacterized damage-inducible protein DinB